MSLHFIVYIYIYVHEIFHCYWNGQALGVGKRYLEMWSCHSCKLLFYQTCAGITDSKTNNSPTATLLLGWVQEDLLIFCLKIHCVESALDCVLSFASHYSFSCAPNPWINKYKYCRGHFVAVKWGQNNFPLGGLAFRLFSVSYVSPVFNLKWPRQNVSEIGIVQLQRTR